MNKKGLSPLIATFILIAFSVALGAIVMSWGRGYISENAEFVTGAGGEGCVDVSFRIYALNNYDACLSGNQVELYVENGPVALAQMRAAIIGAEGVTNVENILSHTLAASQTEKLNIPITTSTGAVEQIKLTPSILVDGELSVCANNAQVVKHIGPC